MGTFQVGMMLPAGALGEEHRGRTPRVRKLLTAGEISGQWVKPGQVSIRFSMICHDFKGLTCSNYVIFSLVRSRVLASRRCQWCQDRSRTRRTRRRKRWRQRRGGWGVPEGRIKFCILNYIHILHIAAYTCLSTWIKLDKTDVLGKLGTPLHPKWPFIVVSRSHPRPNHRDRLEQGSQDGTVAS